MKLGGGCGALGALLHKAGYPCISTDITQAFYLTQNFLWHNLFPDGIYECIDSIEGLNEKKREKIIHVPYWKLWELKDSDLEADIMVANNCLAELHPRALRFYLQYGKHLMRNSRYKLLIAQTPGSLINRTYAELLKNFDEMGWALLYSDKNYFIFSPNEKENIAPKKMTRYFKRHKLYKEMPVIWRLCYHAPIYKSSKDQTTREYLEKQQIYNGMAKIDYKAVMEGFSSISDQLDTPDEEFVHFCNYEYI